MHDTIAFFRKVQAAGLWPAGVTEDQVIRDLPRIRSIVEMLEEHRAAGEPWPPSTERVKAAIDQLDAEWVALEGR